MNSSQHNRPTVLIIGDVVLDIFVMGKVTRQSVEAPIPVLDWSETRYTAGGAANVATNIQSLDGRPVLLGFIGKDLEGNLLKDILSEKEISVEYLLESPLRPTTHKQRFFDDEKPMMRLDKEITHPIYPEEWELMRSRFLEILEKEKPDVAILQDYNKGIFTKDAIDFFLHTLKEKKIPVAVDPKKDHFFDYKNVFLFKPNLREISDAFAGEIAFRDSPILAEVSDLDKVSSRLFEKTGCRNVLITLSDKGIYYNDGKNSAIIPRHAEEITDVSGAGDTVIAAAAMAYMKGKTLPEIAKISNIAGGLVCKKKYIAVIQWHEINPYL